MTELTVEQMIKKLNSYSSITIHSITKDEIKFTRDGAISSILLKEIESWGYFIYGIMSPEKDKLYIWWMK